MPIREVTRQFGEKLRELIPEETAATMEMQTLVLRLALLETVHSREEAITKAVRRLRAAS